MSYESPDYSVVFGDLGKGVYKSCGEMRIDSNRCGLDAKLWAPKNSKKHLFNILKREY
jgi:hypothetical protein